MDAWMPRIRRLGQAALAVAALTAVVMVGLHQRIDTPPRIDSPPAEATPRPQSPTDGDVRIPPPWDVWLPQIPTPGPVVSSPQIGFREPPDLSATREAGETAAKLRGGTSSGEGPSQLNAAVAVTILGAATFLTTLTGLVRAWRRWRHSRERDVAETNPVPTDVDDELVDELLGDGTDADEPAPDDFSDASGVEPPDAHGAADPPEPTAPGTPEIEEATSATPRAAGAPPPADNPPRAAGAGLATLPWPPAGSTSATPLQPADQTVASKDKAASRVVLFSATKWGTPTSRD
jgi:hypothetical protein